MQGNEAVLIISFNRPQFTAHLLEVVRTYKPKALYIACDAPRISRPEDQDKCRMNMELVRSYHADFPVHKLYQEENLGAGLHVPVAVSWMFEREERGVILEDDCQPHPDAFPYFTELLNKYANDESVVHISAFNAGFPEELFTSAGYAFSNFPEVWGWATWKRAWQYFPGSLPPEEVPSSWSLCAEGVAYSQAVSLRYNIVDSYNRDHAWDYKWAMHMLSNDLKSIIPRINMVTNVGFGELASNTIRLDDPRASVQASGMSLVNYDSPRDKNCRLMNSLIAGLHLGPPALASRNLVRWYIQGLWRKLRLRRI